MVVEDAGGRTWGKVEGAAFVERGDVQSHFQLFSRSPVTPAVQGTLIPVRVRLFVYQQPKLEKARPPTA